MRTNSSTSMPLTTRETPTSPATTANPATSAIERTPPPPVPLTISYNTETHTTTTALASIITVAGPSNGISIQPGSVTTISSVTTVSATPDHSPGYGNSSRFMEYLI